MNNLSDSGQLYFIVEEGQFNLGNFDKAKLMVELAALTGASAIEFQLTYADDFYISAEPGYKIYKSREFSDEQLKELVQYSGELKIDLIATCLSHKLVSKMAKFGCSAFNLNASDINNFILLDEILETQMPFLVSLPLATEEEISWTVERILSKSPEANFSLLHGQHSMASGKEWVETADTSLGYINTLKRKFNKRVGFIDHTPHSWMPSVAIAAGAEIVSKHLTISHVFKGPDWQICLDPEEMKRTIEMSIATYQSIRISDKHLAKGEDLDRSIMRRSVVSSKKIPKGKKIEMSDVCFKRPGTGLSPPEALTIIGKISLVEIEADTLLHAEMFK